MHLEKRFSVAAPRDLAVEVIDRDETLLALFPETQTEIIEKKGDRKTTRSRFRALGREGEVTFHFTFLMDGNVRFEKVCDGNVWRELHGEVCFEEMDGGATEVCIEMTGSTRSLVPEFTIKGPMSEQLDQMTTSLKRCIEDAAGG